jgi:hypothetical protein
MYEDMNYKVKMLDRLTQNKVDFWSSDDWTDEAEFLWSDGNMSCDCTRSVKFGIENEQCNRGGLILAKENRFIVLSIFTENAEMVYSELKSPNINTSTQ